MNFVLKNYNLLLFLACYLLIGSGFFIEYYFLLPPCPLCTLQRICYGLIGLFAFLGFLSKPNNFFTYLQFILIEFFTLIGLIISGWQVWIQYFAKLEPGYSCVGNLSDLFSSYSFTDFFSIIFSNNSDCSDISFTIFGFSIAVWSLFIFFSLTFVNLAVVFCKKKAETSSTL